MKKLILHALCALTLCAGMPAHAMYDRVKSYMPKMSMPKISIPSVDYKTAVKRFSIAKQRFEKALKSNKKAIITTAAVALLAAIGMVLRARSQAAAAPQDAPAGDFLVGVSEDGYSSSYSSSEGELVYPPEQGGHSDDDHDVPGNRMQALLQNEDGDVQDLIVLIKGLVTDTDAVDSITLSVISDSEIAQNQEKRAELAQFFLSDESMNPATGIYTDDAARAKARELFGTPHRTRTVRDLQQPASPPSIYGVIQTGSYAPPSGALRRRRGGPMVVPSFAGRGSGSSGYTSSDYSSSSDSGSGSDDEESYSTADSEDDEY